MDNGYSHFAITRTHGLPGLRSAEATADRGFGLAFHFSMPRRYPDLLSPSPALLCRLTPFSLSLTLKINGG
jgi:hypothetical protein